MQCCCTRGTKHVDGCGYWVRRYTLYTLLFVWANVLGRLTTLVDFASASVLLGDYFLITLLRFYIIFILSSFFNTPIARHCGNAISAHTRTYTHFTVLRVHAWQVIQNGETDMTRSWQKSRLRGHAHQGEAAAVLLLCELKGSGQSIIYGYIGLCNGRSRWRRWRERKRERTGAAGAHRYITKIYSKQTAKSRFSRRPNAIRNVSNADKWKHWLVF